jgi:Raf kinase inhibitor-like YbhB/YbcL family protein
MGMHADLEPARAALVAAGSCRSRRRTRRRGAALALAVVGVVAGCGGKTAESGLPAAPRKLQIASPAFPPGGQIPRRYTCEGTGVSPPLRWSRVPAAARSLALVVEDEDAKGFVHWTVLDLAPRSVGVAEGRLPRGAVETQNSFGDRRWGGPCPPGGARAHRYRFTLYALSKRLVVAHRPSPDDVRQAIRAAALARGDVTGTFAR